MPIVFLYLGIMLAIIIVWFMLLKRPIYEAILISFIALLTITNTWGQLGTFINDSIKSSLLYSMTAFIAMSVILTKTKLIDGAISIILSLLGKFPGGAGYVSLIASSFMGALSGSGPGNVMATGTITIPAMKKSGYPAELAANIESSASCMGNMIPPSANIVAALGAFTALYPDKDISVGKFWIILWGIGIWFILQRLITIFVFCKIYKIRPMAKEDIPDLKESVKTHWKSLFLPVIILLPFLLDYLFKDNFFTERLGAAGAKSLSSSLLLFIAGIASMYACLIVKDKKSVTPHKIAMMFANGVKTLVPTVAVCVFSYMIGALFESLNVASEVELFILEMQLTKFPMIIFICLLTCFLGMIILGSSMIAIFGSVFITTLASVGVDPLLAAAMLPCICGVMSHITPPLGLCLYAGMSLAESDFSKTIKNNFWWIAGQFILQIVVLMGFLPILGM